MTSTLCRILLVLLCWNKEIVACETFSVRFRGEEENEHLQEVWMLRGHPNRVVLGVVRGGGKRW